MGEDRTGESRVSVYEAAEILGVTVDAIRKRITRDTIPHEKDDDGRVWVILDIDQDTTGHVRDTDRAQSDITALISAKDETIANLREQLEQANERDRENRRIIVALTSRIPAIEAPQEASEAAETGGQGRGQPHSATVESQESAQRPWWRRVFGG